MKTLVLGITVLLFSIRCFAGTGIGINVKDAPYNAAGDGTTDDTAAIQAALDAAVAAGGGTVTIPAGTYKTSNTLLMGSNTHLVGGGRGATTIRPIGGGFGKAVNGGGTVYATVAMVAADNSSVAHLTVDHQTNSTLVNGIAMMPDGQVFSGTVCTRCTVEDCEVLGFNSHQYLIWNLRGQFIKILNNHCDGGVTAQTGSYLQEGIESYGGYDVLIQGNTVLNIANSGINICTTAGLLNDELHGVRAVDNYVRVARVGVYCNSASDDAGPRNTSYVQIKNNTIVEPWSIGIDVEQALNSTIEAVQISGNSIVSAPYGIYLYCAGDTRALSIVQNLIYNPTTIGRVGIFLNTVTNTSVTANTVRNTLASMQCFGSSNITIQNNIFDTAQQNGLYLGTSRCVAVKNNRFTNYNAAAGRFPGVLAVDTQKSLIIANEFFTQNDITAVSAGGSAGNEVRITANSLLYTSSVATPFINGGTNPNEARVKLTAGTNRITVQNTLVNPRTRFLITQLTGKPLAFRAGPVNGGFEIVTATNGAGDETFSYELIQ